MRLQASPWVIGLFQLPCLLLYTDFVTWHCYCPDLQVLGGFGAVSGAAKPLAVHPGAAVIDHLRLSSSVLGTFGKSASAYSPVHQIHANRQDNDAEAGRTSLRQIRYFPQSNKGGDWIPASALIPQPTTSTSNQTTSTTPQPEILPKSLRGACRFNNRAIRNTQTYSLRVQRNAAVTCQGPRQALVAHDIRGRRRAKLYIHGHRRAPRRRASRLHATSSKQPLSDQPLPSLVYFARALHPKCCDAWAVPAAPARRKSVSTTSADVRIGCTAWYDMTRRHGSSFLHAAALEIAVCRYTGATKQSPNTIQGDATSTMSPTTACECIGELFPGDG